MPAAPVTTFQFYHHSCIWLPAGDYSGDCDQGIMRVTIGHFISEHYNVLPSEICEFSILLFLLESLGDILYNISYLVSLF